jgi:hypothetical protein
MNKKDFYRKDYLTFKRKYRLFCKNEPANLICLVKPNINSNFVNRITINEIKKDGLQSKD